MSLAQRGMLLLLSGLHYLLPLKDSSKPASSQGISFFLAVENEELDFQSFLSEQQTNYLSAFIDCES